MTQEASVRGVSSPAGSGPLPGFPEMTELFSGSEQANLPPTGELGSMSAPDYFEAGLPIVEEVTRFHSQRGRLGFEEREEFHSFVIEKLIENDYARIRKFEGRSSFRTFLSVIVAHLLVDFWESKGGRRRPSSAARLLAPEGVWIERYLRRGHTVAEAVQMVKENHNSALSKESLHDIASQVPAKRKEPVHVSALGTELGGMGASPERLVEAKANDASRLRLEALLERALACLSADERVFVRMRFEDGVKINEIAKAFHLPEKAFYRRFQKALRRLRKALEGYGIDSRCLELYGEGEERPANFST